MLVFAFSWRLRRGLTTRIHHLAQAMADTRLVNGLFPGLEREVKDIQHDQQQLNTLTESTANFRKRLAGSSSFLGGRK